MDLIIECDWFKRALISKCVSANNNRCADRASHSIGRSLSTPHQMTPTDCVTAYAHPDELPSDVNRLFEGAEKEDMGLGVSWYRNLVNTVFPDDRGVRIFVLRQSGLPVAALPIRLRKNSLWREVESLGNYYTAIYAPILAKGVTDRDLARLIKAILRANPAVASMRFAPMDPKSEAYIILMGALKLTGMRPFEFFCFGNWFLRVDGDWTNYLKCRSGTQRNTIKRMGKRFASDEGTLELIQLDADLERGLDAYQRVYAASWKDAEPFTSFVPGLARACAARGWLRLGVAWLKDKPIAAQLWIVAGNKASIYKVAYDDAYKAYAPGTLLTAMLMQHVIDQDSVSEVDYLIGDDAYKKTWMSDRRERWGLIAYNPWSPLGLVGLAQEMTGRLVKTLRSKMKPRIDNAEFAANTVDAPRAPTPVSKLQKSAESPLGKILP